MQNVTKKEASKEEATAAAASEDKQDGEAPTTNAYSLLPATDATWLAHSSDKPLHSMPLTVDMSIIPVTGDKEPKTLRMLLDTGAARSFVAEDWRDNNMGFIHGTREEEVDVMLADKRRFTARQSVLLYVSPPGKTGPLPIWCLVSSSLSTPVILGMASLRSLRLMLYLSPDSVLLKSGVSDSAIRSLSSSTSEDTGCRAMASDKVVSLLYKASESQFGEKQVGLDLMLLCEPECHQSMLCSVLTERMPPEFSDLEGSTLPSSERGLEDPSSPSSDEDGNNKTLFVGLTPADHLTIEGQKKDVSRYTYSIPWLADKRPVVPDRRTIEKAIHADRKFCDRLQESGHLDAYSAVFDKYLLHGIIEVVPPEHYVHCKALLRHFAVHSDSRTTPVRPVLDGRAFAGLIGSGLGNKSSKDRVLRSTLRALGGFRLYKCAATLDVTMAFYMLLHTYDDSFYFCIPFRGRLYRLRAPPMGGPHSPGCLLDAMQRLCDEALSDFVCLYPHLVKNGLVPVCFCFYMDDLVVGADTPQLLSLAIRCLLTVCDRHGFNCSEKKRQIGPPEGANAAHVLGLQWNKNDQICIVLPDPSSLPPPYSCPSNDNLLAVTIRDLMGYVARIYNPLGFIGHMLLAMRLVVKEELDRTVDKDLDSFITIPSYDSILRFTEDLARFPGIPRVLSVREDPTICVFMDASGFGYGIVVTDSLFNIIRCNSKIISGPRTAWSIVKKELYALQQSVIFYEETCLALLAVDKPLQLVPQFYTDNAADYFRLRKAMQYAEEEDSSQPWPPKHLDIRPWEAKVLLQLAKDIKDLQGSVYHLAGRHNPADAFSRGNAISVLPQVDEGLKLAVEVARRREGLSYDYDYETEYKLGNEECLCTIQLSDSENPVSLKEAIISMQYGDSTLGRLLDPEKFGCPEPRLLRKYSVIYPRDGTPKYVVNAVTDGLVVPYGRQSDVVKALHLFYSHLGSHKLYKSTVHDFDCGSLKNFVSCQHDCEVCRVQRGYRSLSHRLGRSLSRTDRAWEVLNVDLIGPFMQKDRVVYDSKVESTMCLVLVDSYTGFLAYSVLHDYAPGIEVAKSLNGICLDHQYPKGIVSDNDSRFCSVPVSSWALGMGIRWATVPPHCSRWNGWAESKHKLINYFLRALLTECGYDKPYQIRQAAAAFLDKNIPLKMPSNDELELMILDYSRRLTEDSKWVAVDAENLDATLRSRKVLADESVLRSNFDTLKLDPYWNPVVYKVISIRGQIAAITSDPLRARPFFEYIGNLKRIEV
ncbi:hypothetical protein FOL47_007366 [Perkinsus chesapeaki]|uniref:Integrase catalytic domain-containing protein n=1 Tax=Perkinsus chesapeaki TaxID=330153 RepID=A0A7J6LLP3_PERCH|nr:hypothetical protein FOL47_007366 [Perkinsus chesapeaki]